MVELGPASSIYLWIETNSLHYGGLLFLQAFDNLPNIKMYLLPVLTIYFGTRLQISELLVPVVTANSKASLSLTTLTDMSLLSVSVFR